MLAAAGNSIELDERRGADRLADDLFRVTTAAITAATVKRAAASNTQPTTGHWFRDFFPVLFAALAALVRRRSLADIDM